MAASKFKVILLVLFAIKSQFTSCQYDNWIAPTYQLPTSGSPLFLDKIAVGHWGDGIYMMDGTKLQIYNLTTATVSHTNYSAFSIATSGDSLYYFQQGSLLWTIDYASGNRFNVFNMESKTFSAHYQGINIPTKVGSDGCLSNYNHNDNQYIIVLGGLFNSMIVNNDLQIYNLSSGEWLSNTPSMIVARAEFACIVHPATSQLFAFGGYNLTEILWNPSFDIYTNYKRSIEKLYIGDIENLANYNWEYNIEPLNYPMDPFGAVVYGDDILLVAGKAYDGDLLDTVFVINAITGEVSYGGTLADRAGDASPIIANGIIYLMGGTRGDNWQYMFLLSGSFHHYRQENH